MTEINPYAAPQAPVDAFLAIYLVFFQGSEGGNNYGPAPAANTLGVKILRVALPTLFLIGIIAAIAIPAYMNYTYLTQQMEQK